MTSTPSRSPRSPLRSALALPLLLIVGGSSTSCGGGSPAAMTPGRTDAAAGSAGSGSSVDAPAGGAGGGNPTAGSAGSSDAGGRGTAGAPAPANIIFVLTDDLSVNLVRYMPHVLQMQREGVTFTNYFVSDSLCCPSRTSMFTGKYPHNSGVFTNTGDDGGYA